LITVIGLLAAAAFGRHYRPVGRAGAAACVGITLLDTGLLITVPVTLAALAWPLVLAASAGAARLMFTLRTLRPVLAG
jgi:hypothetical protein